MGNIVTHRVKRKGYKRERKIKHLNHIDRKIQWQLTRCALSTRRIIVNTTTNENAREIFWAVYGFETISFNVVIPITNVLCCFWRRFCERNTFSDNFWALARLHGYKNMENNVILWHRVREKSRFKLNSRLYANSFFFILFKFYFILFRFSILSYFSRAVIAFKCNFFAFLSCASFDGCAHVCHYDDDVI